MFASLHTRSHYSFLQGASSPLELAAAAAAAGHGGLCLTDVNGTYGAVKLQRACQSYGLRPVIGAEFTLAKYGNLVAIALSMDGYASLCSLLTAAHLRSRESPMIELQDLALLDSSVAVLTGGREGWAHNLARMRNTTELAAWLQTLQKLCQGPLFVELIHHRRPGDTATARRMVDVALNIGVPAIIGSDVRHATASDYDVYDAMTCIRLGCTVFDHHADRPVNDEQHLKSEPVLRKFLPYAEAFDAVTRLLSQAQFDLLPNHITPPQSQLNAQASPDDTLRALCNDAFVRRYQGTSWEKRAREQLDHECRVIAELELSDFFLVVKEVIDESRRRGIRSSGRGSAANSIVAYLLRITGVCPLRHNLLFERFLHRGRKGTPDIDVDFDSDRRSEVISWMEQRFGIDHTAMTGTLITYRIRMAIRDAAKALGWPLDTVHQLSKAVPGYTTKKPSEYYGELSCVTPPAPLLHTLVQLVERLEDRPRHLGQHSGGMILSRVPLWQRTPIQQSANGVKVVQFDKDDVEAMGLVKFDVLGLRMLACISETMELIRRHEQSVPDIDELPLDVPEVFDLMKSGKTLGVFQIESQGQMHLLAQHQPDSFDDLITEVALFRPGPLQGGMVNPYVRRRRGLEPVSYLHPDLEPILRDTLGIILFQEQVLEIAHRFAGMPLDEADDFRALVSKNRDRKAMEEMRSRFINGAVSRGVDHQSAEIVYEKVSHFVGYGFCRSHAAAFAKIVYQSAWLKVHYTAAYLAAFMQHRPGFYSLMTLEEEARRFGVPVLMPDVHKSGIRYDLERTEAGRYAIRKPLPSVRGVSVEQARTIIWARAERPFTSVEDLYMRTHVDMDALEQLALAGAMDNLAGSSRKALWELGILQRRASARKNSQQQGTLFELNHIADEDVPILPPLRAQERLAYDYRSHGSARIHPMTLYRRTLTDLEVRPIETAFLWNIDESAPRTKLPEITVAGIVILRQSPPTANGVLFVTIEDETGFLQCVVQPNERDRFRAELKHAAMIVRGRIHAKAQWRGLVVLDVRILSNVIGGYYGHPHMYGGTDTMELSTAFNDDTHRKDQADPRYSSIG